MRDDAYGHRDFFSGSVFEDKDEWVEWDFALVTALQTIEDSTDKYGLLTWQVEPEDIEINAEKRIHKFQASVDRATAGSDKKPYKPQPGEYFLPDMWSRGADKDRKPTYREWLDSFEKDSKEAT